MKFYIGDDKRLIVKTSWNDRFDQNGGVFVFEPKSKIQLISEVAVEIEQDIRKAVADVISRHQAKFDKIPLEDIFEEKRKQVRESYDTEQAIADAIERWKK